MHAREQREPHDQGLAAAVATGLGVGVRSLSPQRGGDVAEAYAADLEDGRRVFAKTHRAAPPQFFSTEAAGLSWLRAGLTAPGAGAVGVPEPLLVSDGDPSTGVPAHLVLEWIDQRAGRGDDGEAAFGEALADLHRSGAPAFGRQDRRPTGSRGLPNEPCATWTEFYATRRLLPLARLAFDAAALAPPVVDDLERVADRLIELGGPPEPPARLHGDLWCGNRLVDRSGRHWLIDPAAHGGHREFDLAMMALFGGFGAASYAAYQEAFPLAAGWEDRVALHQLAPLVVHAIKFGGAYRRAAADAIGRYR